MYESTVFIALSRQMAMTRQMDVIANNLANMSTTAFKSERMLFQEFLMNGTDGRQLSYVQDVGVARNHSEGKMEPTTNPLDIAIHGQGYLSVQTPDGVRYTRNGHLRLDAAGTLTTASGEAVLGANQRPVVLGPNARDIVITSDGTVSAAGAAAGRISLVSFDNEYQLRPVGDSLYETDAASKPSEDAQIVQGMIEQSNVEPIVEMSNMIQVSRSYQSSQDLMRSDDEMRRRSIRDLGKVV